MKETMIRWQVANGYDPDPIPAARLRRWIRQLRRRLAKCEASLPKKQPVVREQDWYKPRRSRTRVNTDVAPQYSLDQR